MGNRPSGTARSGRSAIPVLPPAEGLARAASFMSLTATQLHGARDKQLTGLEVGCPRSYQNQLRHSPSSLVDDAPRPATGPACPGCAGGWSRNIHPPSGSSESAPPAIRRRGSASNRTNSQATRCQGDRNPLSIGTSLPDRQTNSRTIPFRQESRLVHESP